MSLTNPSGIRDINYFLFYPQIKYKISTMSSSKEESFILNKISLFVNKIQDFYMEAGCSKRQIACYFARRVFESKAKPTQGESVQSFYKRQIQHYLKDSVERHGSTRVALVHLLAKLEIENGQIEIFQSQILEHNNNIQTLEKHRENLHEQFTYKPRRMFGMGMLKQDSVEGNKNIVKDLEQIKNFERELQESLMKTKLLKRLIQQRIEEDLQEPFNSGFNCFRNLLSLESSG